MITYTPAEVYDATLKYFNGDEVATKAWINKTTLRNKQEEFLELIPDDRFKTIASEVARIEGNYPNPLKEEEIYEALKGMKNVVFQGSPMYGIGNPYTYSMLSNCTVVESPVDSISGIMKTATQLANLYKNRAGGGVDISPLRPEHAYVNNSAKYSTGAWSFADLYSHVTRSIGQAGRYGALMIMMSIRHPDIFKFVTMKHDLSKVTGANISVKAYDDFMKAVESDTEYTLYWPVDSDKPSITKTIKAKQLWDVIITEALERAEPGITFWDRHIEYNPSSVYDQLRPIATNPCAEEPLSGFDACRLISYNLKHIVDWRHGVDYHLTTSEENRIKKYVRIAVRLADDMVDLEFEKLQNLMDKSWKDNDKDAWYLWKEFMETGKLGRRVGLSIHGLADLIARLGIRYDSDEALDVVGRVFSLIRDTAYETSIQLAKERGAFPLFDWELEKNNEYILNLPEGIKEELKLHGRRNVCLLTCAPAGTVSILSQTSSGIEPVFANEYVRKCRINDADSTEGKKVITHEDGGKFFEYTVYHKNLEEWKELNPNQPIPDFFVEAGKIDWLKRIQLQGIIQKYVDASISSTLNLVKGTTKETVSQVYMEAWKHGLKGVTVYVDGSREGILNHVEKEETKEEPFGYKEAPKRPEVLECDIHYTQIGKEEWIVLVGLWNGKPYEIFSGEASHIKLPKKHKRGHIIKRNFKTKVSEYDLYLERATENEMVVKNIVKMFENPTHGVLGRLISLSLRHGSAPIYTSEQLFKDDDSDFMNYNKVVGRILKKYIKEGAKSGSCCTDCGAELIYESGCAICRSCGFSKCN